MGLNIAILHVIMVFLSSWVSCGTASVSYDHKAISVNGQRRILISGSIHYPRSTPEVYLLQMYIIVSFVFRFPGK